MKRFMTIFLALSCHAATTNFVSVTGNTMSGIDNSYSVIDPSDLYCATGGLVTNFSTGTYVVVCSQFPKQGVAVGCSVQRIQGQGFVYISPYQCTNVNSITEIDLTNSGTLNFGSYQIDGSYLPVTGGFSNAPVAPNSLALWLNGNTNFGLAPTPWIQVVNGGTTVTNYLVQMVTPEGIQTLFSTTNTSLTTLFPYPPTNGTTMTVVSNYFRVQVNQAQILFHTQ